MLHRFPEGIDEILLMVYRALRRAATDGVESERLLEACDSTLLERHEIAGTKPLLCKTEVKNRQTDSSAVAQLLEYSLTFSVCESRQIRRFLHTVPFTIDIIAKAFLTFLQNQGES